jgi:two-component system, LytTR family, response regulator
MQLKAVIVDDEKGARESLHNLVQKFCPQIEVSAKAENIEDAYTKIVTHNPELVFLDIEMPNGNGFDLLKKFSELKFDIIFTTAYDHYAIKAIKYSAIDYLLKPIDIDDLKNSVLRVLQKRENKALQNEQILSLLNNIKPDQKEKKVALPEGDGLTFVNIKDIVRCESDGNYTTIILQENKRIVTSRTLGEYEELFANEGFFRIHRSHLIQLNHLKKYIKGEGGYAIMSDGSQVEVSRRKKTEFLEKLSSM